MSGVFATANNPKARLLPILKICCAAKISNRMKDWILYPFTIALLAEEAIHQPR